MHTVVGTLLFLKMPIIKAQSSPLSLKLRITVVLIVYNIANYTQIKIRIRFKFHENLFFIIHGSRGLFLAKVYLKMNLIKKLSFKSQKRVYIEMLLFFWQILDE